MLDFLLILVIVAMLTFTVIAVLSAFAPETLDKVLDYLVSLIYPDGGK